MKQKMAGDENASDASFAVAFSPHAGMHHLTVTVLTKMTDEIRAVLYSRIFRITSI